MEKKNIPFYTISGKARFNRQELEEWLMDAAANGGKLPSFETDDGSSTWNKFCLYRAIHKGCVIEGISKGSKEEIIRTVMHEAASVLKINPEIVSEMLIERENLMSTANVLQLNIPNLAIF